MRFTRGLTASSSLRAKAIGKLTKFSTDTLDEQRDDGTTLDLITRTLPIFYSTNTSKIYTMPLTLSEWEVLTSLCTAIPTSFDLVEKMIKEIIEPYFLESPRQRISDVLSSRFKLKELRNPIELLTFQLTKFMIHACEKYPILYETISGIISVYFERVLEVFTVKQSGLLSLIGFINAFIRFPDSAELTKFAWRKLAKLVFHGPFLSEVEAILNSSTAFTNDSIVQYYDAGNELSGAYILELVSRLQISLISHLLHTPDINGNLDEFLLKQQHQFYKFDQEAADIGTDTKSIDEFFFNIRCNKEFFVDVCNLSLKFCSESHILDLSTDNRAKFSFDTRAHYLQTLCLIPFIEDTESEMFESFTKIVSESVDKFFLSDVVTPLLTKAIVTSASLLNFFTEKLSLTLIRMFPLLVASPHITTSTVKDVAKIFTTGLYPLNEDAIVSTIYSMNNLLAVSEDGSPAPVLRERQLTITSGKNIERDYLPLRNSFPSLNGASAPLGNATVGQISSHDANSGTTMTYHASLISNCVAATTTIASYYNTQSITALTISILTQKVNAMFKEFDSVILDSLARLAPNTSVTEFSLLLKFFKSRTVFAAKNNDSALLENIINAKSAISKELLANHFSSDLYFIYLHDLLDSIISSGEVERLEHHRPQTEISRVADQIATYLKPLAALLPDPGKNPIDISKDEASTNKFRNAWFNFVIHGYHLNAPIVKENFSALLTIASNSPPLASEFPANNKELSLEMNTILRRGSSNENIKQQKQQITEYFNTNIVQYRTTSSSKIMFLAAAALLETIRCEAGDCSKTLLYFSDASILSGSIEKCIAVLSVSMIRKYAKLIQRGNDAIFNSKMIAQQLNNLLLCLSHREPTLQDAAFHACEIFIRSIPSSLCHHLSLYTLLDMLTALFDSILDSESNKFEPRYEFKLKHSRTKILIPSSASWRTATLSRLHKSAKEWVRIVLNRSNQDAKILLQSYISDLGEYSRLNSVEFGVSFAMDMAGLILPADKELSRLTYYGPEKPNTISGFISLHSWRSKYLFDTAITSSPEDIKRQITISKKNIRKNLSLGNKVVTKDVTDFLDMSTALLILGNGSPASLVYDIVHIPFEVFTSASLKIATNVWLTIITEKPEVAHLLLVDVCYCWMRSIDDNIGLYSRDHDIKGEEYQKMEYSPYDKAGINRDAKNASQAMQPHLHVIKFFASHFEGTLFQSDFLLKIFTKCVLYGIKNLYKASLHPFARMIRHELLLFATLVLNASYKQGSKYIGRLSQEITNGALSWFKKPVAWPFGSNELKIKADLSITRDLFVQLNKLSSLMTRHCGKDYKILNYFLASEIQQIQTWLTPMEKIEGANSNELSDDIVESTFANDPILAINLLQRCYSKKAEEALVRLVEKHPLMCVGSPSALDLFIKGSGLSSKKDLHAALYWIPVSPLKSINLFLPEWQGNPFILQFSIYSLESQDVNLVFFYVPQIVQCLRYDKTGYVERLILDTAKISVLFSHQIIWNMLANCYKDDEGIQEDEIKPTLDRIRERMVSTFSQTHREFYEREFEFFDEVTGISGKLKPYLKKSKAEKKHKIDEEMSTIEVKPDVYLPSNPDGVVIDIDRKSGKPLQSHAKAPFMATFKIKKEVQDPLTKKSMEIEKWQGAIFKVGDDCRQDVLALQLVSLFRTIWSSIGLDVYVFPYRVTATAPGCGVIDVLPNSVSRDMLGREAVNGLYEYFTSKFGNESTIEFQNARNNFVKSLAGYSVISYLLQFKDRHNGNIMYDDQGHCLHIDFGFIFDIVPGGIKFEAVPFKLTKEMVKVMGGSPQTPAYLDFEELCIKAYLAARPHVEAIIECVNPMLGSGLPCFKGHKTIKNLRARFQPQKTDHEAALCMKTLIRKSYESIFTKGYDEFQRLTNGIPY
ncbi:hypothetical protein SEUBUCD650_0L03510 [Saccharomyces eubayanus]|uniref:1-phosphatidylinositol 4-kinase n=1 Tax=Saccharomyces eubayanus TaxID=1080349 RepID=A0ABN8VFE6_SACEU|nr:hypothetical protein SEUBUCD650_0L03510 [Saccharomyces eubayanus]